MCERVHGRGRSRTLGMERTQRRGVLPVACVCAVIPGWCPPLPQPDPRFPELYMRVQAAHALEAAATHTAVPRCARSGAARYDHHDSLAF